MSIFKNTLQPTVRAQLKVRQDALKLRTSDAIIHANSRSSWIRMTSSVNVEGKDTLANQYILQGGVLLDKKLREGVGDASKAYSNFSPSLRSYNNPNAKAGTAGIKPMPGIKSIDIKSKSAYGSLREVTVNFSCHNIQQLEDLELLYMRPGYTVLVEWGWAPYLNENGKIENNIEFYDGVLKGGKTREEVWLDIYKLSIKKHHNYDAMYGYVKNYNWTARMDGGYDCTTTIISVGEIMESLKAGYLPYNISNLIKEKGLLKLLPVTNPLFPFSQIPGAESYSKNILAGLLHEIYNNVGIIGSDSFPKLQISGSATNFVELNKVYDYNLFKLSYQTVPIPNTLLSTSGIQIYITLGSFIDLLNKYILLHAGNTSNYTPIIKLSTKSNTYEDKGEPLLCLAHPLQVSIDPTVCLITNPLWAKGIDFKDISIGAENGASNRSTKYDNSAKEIYKLLRDVGIGNENPIGQKLIDTIGFGKDGYILQNTKDFVKSFYFATKDAKPDIGASTIPKYALNLLSKLTGIKGIINSNVEQIKETDDTYRNLFTLTNFQAAEDEDKANQLAAKKLEEDAKKRKEGAFSVDYLKDLNKGGKKFENKLETGFIENIYINVDFLYRLSIDPNLQTKNQELKLYDYLIKILKEVQESIGGVNNFEIHVDPIDNVARIIDVNYVDTISKKTAYEEAFQIEAQNLSGTVRSYNLQSKIFPEQGAMIAIGAQVKGGNTQGTSNSTLLDFNNGLEDRIISDKVDPPSSNLNSKDPKVKFISLQNNINKITDFFFPPPLKPVDNTPPTYDQANTSEYKTALKDLIAYFQEIVETNTNGRSIIPVQISLTMDGIGGLVIGHLFKIPPDLLPRGYGSDNIGGKLIQTITSISHKVENGDWTTTIDALNIVTRDSFIKNNLTFNDLLTETEEGIVVASTIPKNVYDKLKEVPYEQTTVSKAEVIAYLNYATAFDVNIKRSVLAIWRNESANGSKGVNNNYFGIQADNSKWPDGDAFIIGTSVKVDSGGATRRFAVFADYKSNLNFMLNTIRRKNLVGNTAEEWAKKYVFEWISPYDKEGTYQAKKANLVSIYKDSIKDLPK